MKHILFIASLLLLTSCYQEIDLDKYRNDEGENILTINAIQNPDSLVSAFATRTFFYTDDHFEPEFVDSLDIELWMNGKFVQVMNYNASKNKYEADVYPKKYDKIELRTQFKQTEIAANSYMPEKVEIESVKSYIEGPTFIFQQDDYLFNHEITFTDNPDEENFYFLHITSAYGIETGIANQDYDGETVFQELKQQLNDLMPGASLNPYNGLPFTDKTINGTTHTLKVKEVMQRHRNWSETEVFYPKITRIFRLYAISKEYYNYLFDMLRQEQDSGIGGGLIDIGVVEPAKIYSNIEGGTGILGCYAVDCKEYFANDLLKK